MSILGTVTSGRVAKPRKTLIYGCHGDGKSTWASKWPKPLFLPTEDGTGDLDVTRTKLLKSPVEVVEVINELLAIEDSPYETVVIDSIDWLEKQIGEALHAEEFKTGYGQGAIETARRIGVVLKCLDRLIEKGIHVILIGHAEQRTFTTPHGDAFTQYAPRLTKHSAAVCSEWVDELVFSRQVVKSKVKEVGMKEIRLAVDTGQRVLYTEGSTAFQAKHRAQGLKPNYDLSDVSSYLSDLGL